MDLNSILDATCNNTIYDEVIKDYYNNRIIILNDEINENLIEDCIIYILKWNQSDKGLSREDRKPITIYLNSGGGDSFIAMQLVDVIKASVTPIKIVGMSLVASAAFHIFIAGHERICFDNTIFLMHDGDVTISNSTSKAKDTMKFIEELDTRYKNHVLSSTKMTEDFYDDHYDIEFFLFGNKAKEYGIVDKIIGEDCTMDYIY